MYLLHHNAGIYDVKLVMSSFIDVIVSNTMFSQVFCILQHMLPG